MDDGCQGAAHPGERRQSGIDRHARSQRPPRLLSGRGGAPQNDFGHRPTRTARHARRDREGRRVSRFRRQQLHHRSGVVRRRRLCPGIANHRASRRMNERTRLLLEAPITPTLLKLAAPNVLDTILGGTGPSLEAALTYSNVVSGGAILVWLFNSLANVIRGTGNMMLPAIVTCAGALALIPLSPCLILGWGPFPRLGVAGGAWALIGFYAIGTAAFVVYLRSQRSVVHPSLHSLGFRWALFREILRVGAVAAVVTLQTNLAVAFCTGLVGHYGTGAMAGYGVGSRLEYLLIPLVFGLGGPLVAMVGTNIGAGQHARARRIAWTGALIAAALTESIGIGAALFPTAWLALFDTDPMMLASGALYLRAVGPVYGLFGLGMALYFASQGTGRLLWPLLGNFTRLVIAAGGGWLVLQSGAGLLGVFGAQGIGLAAFGVIIAAAFAMDAGAEGHRASASARRTATSRARIPGAP